MTASELIKILAKSTQRPELHFLLEGWTLKLRERLLLSQRQTGSGSSVVSQVRRAKPMLVTPTSILSVLMPTQRVQNPKLCL